MPTNLETGREAVGAAIGRIPSGCFVMTAEHDGRATAVLVSWVQQAGFDPLMISVCVKRGRPIQALVDGSGRFLLNIVGNPPTAMFKHFGRGFTLEEDAFAGLSVHDTEFGPLIEGCVGYLGCLVREKVASAEHDLYLAEVVAGQADPRVKPYTHLRGSGLSY